MNAIELLTHKLGKLFIEEGVWLAKIYNCDQAELLYKNKHGKPERLCIGDFGDRSRNMLTLCRSKEVGFWGGPPEAENFYFGTLLTFIVDNILRAQVHDGIGFAWLLTFDGGSKRRLKEQVGNRLPNALAQKTFDWRTPAEKECPFDNPVVDRVEIDGQVIDIYENGGQGSAAASAFDATDTCATVDRWGSSGQIRIRV